MAWSDTSNCYHRTVIIIDRFADGTEALIKNETTCVQPPCMEAGGCGCRVVDPRQEVCEFDPKTGLCGGGMA